MQVGASLRGFVAVGSTVASHLRVANRAMRWATGIHGAGGEHNMRETIGCAATGAVRVGIGRDAPYGVVRCAHPRTRVQARTACVAGCAKVSAVGRVENPALRFNLKGIARDKTRACKSVSLIEQIRMTPSTFEPYNVIVNLVDQQSVRLDVRIPKTPPDASQRVIEARRGQWLFVNEQAQQSLEVVNIFAALLRQFHIALKLPRIIGLAHQMPSCLNRLFASLAW